MRRDAARALMQAAARTMPSDRRAWVQAMGRELDEIDDDGEALNWAAGALWSAALERGRPALVVSGRWGLAALTVVYALTHLIAAKEGAAVVLLGTPDLYHDELLSGGYLEAAADRAAWRPWVMVFLMAMGVTHLGAAIFLAWWRPRRFAAFASAAVIATLLMSLRGALGVMLHDYGPLFWWLPTVLALLLIGAAMLLARLDRRRDLSAL